MSGVRRGWRALTNETIRMVSLVRACPDQFFSRWDGFPSDDRIRTITFVPTVFGTAENVWKRRKETKEREIKKTPARSPHPGLEPSLPRGRRQKATILTSWRAVRIVKKKKQYKSRFFFFPLSLIKLSAEFSYPLPIQFLFFSFNSPARRGEILWRKEGSLSYGCIWGGP